MSDQPKKQELPPLDVTEKDSIAGQRAHRHSKYGFMGMIGCRERQLLAALSDNEAKDARIAELGREVERLKRVEEFVECTGRARAVLDRAQSAEAKLKSVEAAESAYYREGRVDALLARIREAIQ